MNSYIYIHTYMLVCLDTYILDTWILICLYTRILACLHAYIRTHLHTDGLYVLIYMHAYIHIYRHNSCTHMLMCLSAHTLICSCIYVPICLYADMLVCLCAYPPTCLYAQNACILPYQHTCMLKRHMYLYTCPYLRTTHSSIRWNGYPLKCLCTRTLSVLSVCVYSYVVIHLVLIYARI
jgi:hypothetical protein